MDQDRITRIARAMCRAARIDPDQPLDVTRHAERLPVIVGTVQMPAAPAWMHFEREATAFVARHRAVAEHL